ncbi:hypothetical protein ACH5RR_003008 [Cinchona calisaya]|uniref:Uncharacterized protein n=1 Tax=Cinchona calisaya TaxID=153742 RepID=A0ABD3ATK6_9GENT
MGRSTFALVGFLAFFSVILFACITEARKNLEDFQASPSTISTNHDEAKAKDEKQFMKDFDLRNAQVLWYHRNHDEAKAKNEKQFMHDFDSKNAQILLYHRNDDEAKAKDEKQFMKDFDSRNAQVLGYHRNNDEAKAKNEKQFMHDIDSKNANLFPYQYHVMHDIDSKNANLFPYQYHVDVATHKEEKPIKENFDATHAQLLLNHGDDARSKK